MNFLDIQNRLAQPRLKYSYSAEFINEDGVLLLSEKRSIFITGKVYCDILEIIQEDGVTLEQLTSQLQDRYPVFRILMALNKLYIEGFITVPVPGVPPETVAYWENVGINTDRLLTLLTENRVSLEFVGMDFCDEFSHTFHRTGIRLGLPAVLRVVITDDYLHPELSDINREVLETGKSWLLVKPTGVEQWFGPFFVPNQTGCWECLAQRLRNNRSHYAFYQSVKKSGTLPRISSVSTVSILPMAAIRTAMEVIKWLYFNSNQQLTGRIMTLDTFTFETKSHTLIKRPQCPVCGDKYFKIKGVPAPVKLQIRDGAVLNTAGGYREVSPEITLEKYKHHVSPITGVVQTLKKYRPIDSAPVYNYYSGINAAIKSKSLFWLDTHNRYSNGGKGKNWSQARTGALCESIERYCSTYQGDEYTINVSLEELGAEGIHPNNCMNFSQHQFKNRDTINMDKSKFYLLVPQRFDPTLPMDWTPVYSLTRGEFKYLPSCYCYTQYPCKNEDDPFAFPDTNGNAAGNTVEEAILHGFLELVERDAAALWWYNRIPRPAVDLDSFNDPYFDDVRRYYLSIGRVLYTLDLTTDLGIPVFAAVSYCADQIEEEIIFAFGAHVDAKIAIERAVVELNQILPSAQKKTGNGGKKQGYVTGDVNFVHWLVTATRENQPYFKPLENAMTKNSRDYPQLCEPQVYDALKICQERVEQKGLEVLVLDLTRPDVGLPVVKVIVPGLRHFWKRLGPGRLYDVPVSMGWKNAPLEEGEMNPIGMFI